MKNIVDFSVTHRHDIMCGQFQTAKCIIVYPHKALGSWSYIMVPSSAV